MITTNNLFANMPQDQPEEVSDEIFRSANVRIERIVSTGQASPKGFWFNQDWEEWVLLLSGNALIRFDGDRDIRLAPGDYLLIPRHVRHRVEWTDPEQETIWLAVHYP